MKQGGGEQCSKWAARECIALGQGLHVVMHYFEYQAGKIGEKGGACTVDSTGKAEHASEIIKIYARMSSDSPCPVITNAE